MRHGADGTRAHGHKHIARTEYGTQRLVQSFDLFHEHWLDLAARADGAAYGAPVGGGNRRLAGRVHLGDQQRIARRQHSGEVVEQVARTRVAMRLEREHHAAPRVALTDRVEGGGDFGRMVPVVVDDGDGLTTLFSAQGREFDVGDVREPAVDTLEAGESALDGLV